MKYFDAHCHVQFDPYDTDRPEVLRRMQDAEVGGLIVGVDLASSQAAIGLVRNAKTDGQNGLYAAIGLHPNDVLLEEFDTRAFDELAQQPEVVAIGECGLDYFRVLPETMSVRVAHKMDSLEAKAGDPEIIKRKQREVFEQHIELAVKYDKPLMIHSRPSKGSQDAYHETIDILTSKQREYGDKLRGDMHFFVGGVEEARRFIELNFTLSYTAVITFARDYDEVIRFAPLASLLAETDSPFVAPAPNRGKRNEPTAVRDVVRALAGIRGEDEEYVRQTILQNACQIFRISL